MTADDPVLLTARTPWGIRLTLNRPKVLNALSGELVGVHRTPDIVSRRLR